MIRWFKSLNSTAKLMILLIVLFAIAIVTRWEYVKRETIESFRGRFTVEKPLNPADQVRQPAQKADTTQENR